MKTGGNNIRFDCGEMGLTCNNRRLPVVQELNGCAGQHHALVFYSCGEEDTAFNDTFSPLSGALHSSGCLRGASVYSVIIPKPLL